MEVGIGIVGLGNVGGGSLQILTENSKSIAEKLGFPLSVKAVCSRNIQAKKLAGLPDSVMRTSNWRDVVAHPEVDVVVEAIGGTATANHLIEDALRSHKSVVTANK